MGEYDGGDWKKWVHLSGWLIGGVALYFFLADHFDWDVFRNSVTEVDRLLLAVAVSSYMAGLIARAARWTYMVRCHQPLRWTQGYHVIMIANMANFLFPVRFGEILKLVIIKKSCGVSYCSSTAASIIEKVTFFLIIMALLGLAPFAGYFFPGWTGRFFPFLLAMVFFASFFLFMGNKGVDKTKLILERILRAWGVQESRLEYLLANRLVKYAANTMRQCHISSYRGMRFFWVAALGMIIILLDGAANYFLLQAFGLPLTFLQALIAACMFNVLFLLPSPPGQMGTAEMYPVLIYAGGLKLAAPVVASAALVWHMATLGILVILGLVSLYATRLGSRTLIDAARKKDE